MLYKPVLLLFIRNQKKHKTAGHSHICLVSSLPLSSLLDHPPAPSPLPLPPSLPSSLCVACVSSDKGTATVALPLATGSRKCWFPMQPLWANCARSAGILITYTHAHTIKCKQYTHPDMHTCSEVRMQTCMCSVCVCHLSADNDSTISLLPDGLHGKPPGKQPTLCLFDLRVAAQVRGWLANYSSNHSKCFLITLFGHTGWGGAVELKKTQTTIHQLMDSSYTAGWEGWVWVREGETEGGREADIKRKWGKTKNRASEGKKRYLMGFFS